jgi:hypothetical protein
MVTMLTASRTASRRLGALAATLALAFLVAQSAALTHEIEHVLHLHDAPCALHLAADHLVMVSAPGPTLMVSLAPSLRSEGPSLHARPAPPASLSPARAPPLLP